MTKIHYFKFKKKTIYPDVMFINALLIAQMPLNDIDLQYFGKHVRYEIGAFVFSLDDVLHGVLRGNCAPRVASGVDENVASAASLSTAAGASGGAQRPLFNDDDPRAQRFVVHAPDARIHFALCEHNARSPPLRAFACDTPEALRDALSQSTASYLEHAVACEARERSIALPHVFRQYQADFLRDADAANEQCTSYVLQWIVRNSKGECKAKLKELLGDNRNANIPIKVRFAAQSFEYQ